MKHMSFLNVSPIQVFDSTQYNDTELIDDIDDLDDLDLISDCKNKYIQVVETVYDFEDEDTMETIEDSPDEAPDPIEIIQDSPDELMDLLEPIKDIDNSETIQDSKDKVQDLLPPPEDKIQYLDISPSISPNIPEIPTGSTDGVIAKIPVVLAQLVIPLNIISSIELPGDALEIKDIEKRLQLEECLLLQPTNILFLKGSIVNSIDYSTLESSNSEDLCGKLNNYTTNIPFESSTPISFFTKPLDPITNTKEIFQYKDMDSSKLNQISQEFFNEIPFCKLLSSKIIELDEFINSKDSIEIQEKIVIQIRLEILQNQPIAIAPARSSSLKTDNY